MTITGPGGRHRNTRRMRSPRSPFPCVIRSMCSGHTRLAMPVASGETARSVVHRGSLPTRRITFRLWRRYHAAASMLPISFASRVLTRPGHGSLSIMTSQEPVRMSCKETIENAQIDGFQLIDVVCADPFVNLMHCCADKSKLDHRTTVLDKSRIRSSA